MALFTGSGVAIVTPMRENGDVNEEKLGELIEFQIANKTDAIIIVGTTGEGSTLSNEEHIATIAYAVKKVNGRVPVIAGTGSNDTKYSCQLSRAAEIAGADACLLVAPYYNKATQNGLIRHFITTANAVKIPCILYNVPSRTGSNILPETAVYIAKNCENITGIKEASGNIAQVAKLSALADGCIDIYSGNDDMVVPLLSVGGKGVISVLANVAPRETHDMVELYLNGETTKAAEIQLKAMPLISELFSEVNPIPVKAALNLQGWNVGIPRLPLTELEPHHMKSLKKAMADFGCLGYGPGANGGAEQE